MSNQYNFLIHTGLLKNNDTNLLGGGVGGFNNNEHSLRNTFHKNSDDSIVLQKDAAALCQFVYACDPNRDGEDEIFATSSGVWKPFYIETQKSPYSSKMLHALKKFYNYNQQPLDNKLELRVEDEGLLNRFGYDGLAGVVKYGISWMLKDEMVSLENRLADRRIGFFSMIFYKQVTDTMYDIAYVTAGTTANLKNLRGIYDFLVDNLLTNIPQGITGISPQYTRSIQNAKILSKICSENSSTIRNLYFFGHSLGGGMAISNALATGHKAIVFNHAGLNRLRKNSGNHKLINWIWGNENRNLKDYNDSVTSYHTRGDFLTTEKGQGWIGVNQLLSYVSPSNEDGNRITLGEGGHGIVEIIDTYYGLNRISESTIDYIKGF